MCAESKNEKLYAPRAESAGCVSMNWGKTGELWAKWNQLSTLGCGPKVVYQAHSRVESQVSLSFLFVI